MTVFRSECRKEEEILVIEALYLDPEDLKQGKSEKERDCVYLQLLYVICKFLHGLVVIQLETFLFCLLYVVIHILAALHILCLSLA